MLSRCTVRRRTGDFVVTNGFKVPIWSVEHTDLAIRLAGTSNGAARSAFRDAGSAVSADASREAHVPATTANLADGDYIEITSGENAGLVLEVIEATWQDQATARRMPVTSVPRPQEWV